MYYIYVHYIHMYIYSHEKIIVEQYEIRIS
jgi:hypothetical protein